MKKIIRFIYTICLLFIFLFGVKYFYEGYSKDGYGSQNEKKFIIDTRESDYNDVVFYAEGLNLEDFLNIVDKKTYYLEKTSASYEEISYNFEKQYTYAELEDIYKNLNKSDIVKIEKIGTSEDLRSMYSIEIGKGDNVVLMDASVHGSEFANVLFLTKFMTNIVNSYEAGDYKIKELLTNNKIIVVPSQNPDGYEMKSFGIDSIKNKNSFVVKNKNNIDLANYKGNINGIDINRNMPSQHGALYYKNNDISSTLSLEPTGQRLSYYPGETLGSEKETQNIIYWLYKYYKVSSVYISLHSCGRSVYNGKPNLSDEFNSLSEKYSNVFLNYTDEYDIYDKSDEDVGFGNDGTTTDFYSELISGFKFSSMTGRLSSYDYKSKKESSSYNSTAITIETMSKITTDLHSIKNEWYNYDLYDILLDMVELGR